MCNLKRKASPVSADIQWPKTLKIYIGYVTTTTPILNGPSSYAGYRLSWSIYYFPSDPLAAMVIKSGGAMFPSSYGSTGADLRQKASSATLPERPPLPSLLLPSLPSHPLPFFLPFSPFEVGPSNPARGSGEGCKLPMQWGLGRNPSRNRIWCILALKSDIWWQQF